MNDSELVERFLAGTLESFAHREHVRVAYILLGTDEFGAALAVFAERIRVMAAAGADPTKFHVTRTEAWMHLIDAARLSDAARSSESAPVSSDEFLENHQELLRSTLLDDYYSNELLRSDAARTNFVDPDLRPLR